MALRLQGESMGSAKERMFEIMQEEIDRHVAGELGVAVSDLADYPYEVDENASDDGVVYGWAITWDDDAPPGVTADGGITLIQAFQSEEPEGPED